MNETKSKGSRIFRAIGPGLVTACVVIGPGSILTSSKVGAADGFSKIWVVILAAFFMMTYVTLGMRLGMVSGQSNGDLVRKHIGKWMAILIGVCVFFISAAFQFGNNLGAHSALSEYTNFKYWPIVLNALVLLFIFGFKNLYSMLEKGMSFFVALMLVAFAFNLFVAKPDPGLMLRGFFPSGGMSSISLPILGLIGTTFVISAAYYQSYPVRFKGWTIENWKSGMIDSRVSAIIMAVITIILMSTAAVVLKGKDLSSVGDVASGLKPLFGNDAGRAIFCTGLFAAAFSSFIVNSMIGGFILSDALNLGSTPDSRWTRFFTAGVLMIGMVVALYVNETGVKPVSAIVAAQAVTVIAAPLIAGVMLWLTNKQSIMGDKKNGPLMNIAAGIGLLLLLAMSLYTFSTKVLPAFTEG